MTIEDLIPFMPEGSVTIVNTGKDYQNALKEVAKENHKKVEELTDEEEHQALGRVGLCDLDLMIP